MSRMEGSLQPGCTHTSGAVEPALDDSQEEMEADACDKDMATKSG